MKEPEELAALTVRVVEFRQKLNELCRGQETEVVYAALVEYLSSVLMLSDNPTYALGNAVVLLAQYLALKGGTQVAAVDVELMEERDDESESGQSVN